MDESFLRLLHPYQRRVAEMVSASFADGARGIRPGDLSGTGRARPLAAVALMHERVLFVEPNETMCLHSAAMFREMAPTLSEGRLGSGSDIEIDTYQHVRRNLSLLDGAPYDLVVLRERHAATDPAARAIVGRIAASGKDVLVIDEAYVGGAAAHGPAVPARASELPAMHPLLP